MDSLVVGWLDGWKMVDGRGWVDLQLDGSLVKWLVG